MAASRIGQTKMLDKVRHVLSSRQFSEQQIEKVIPRLHENLVAQPKYLTDILDCWYTLMTHHPDFTGQTGIEMIPVVAKPPKSSPLHDSGLDINKILADIEPDLLNLCPKKVFERFAKLEDIRLIRNSSEHWAALFNAPRGTYMQEWKEILKKIYYIENNIVDMLFDKREQKEMIIHPIMRNCAVLETDFNKIRVRYLFAERSGYKSLSHMFNVQTALNKPTIGDLLLSNTDNYLRKFSPFCSREEYEVFSDMIQHKKIDDDDADLVAQLADLNTT